MGFEGLTPGAPPRSQRQWQTDETHARIVEAAITLMSDGGEERVTMRAVAGVARVTERTVHRHFETRDDLISAVWRRMFELVGREDLPQTVNALVERPRRLFPRLAKQRKLVHAYLYSRARKAQPSRPNGRFQRAMVARVEDALMFLDEDSLHRRAAVIHIIGGAYAWALMREFWGFSDREAATASAEAIEILLDRRPAH